ncbi:BTAD domain-containing putative transcriptional regulator [Streptomyces sp. NPDC006430]|uniref:AfsR/SARP family transcriptional regulator n=1 Tax=Streptomyces sp. NPDC006430 TaxID=3154299 RepID=UPI00339EC408
MDRSRSFQGDVDAARAADAAPVGAREPSRSAVRLALLGGFSLAGHDGPLTVPPASERVLAFVALSCRGAVPRTLVAGTLWPDAPQRCANANLRSALSRLRNTGREALDVNMSTLSLAHHVTVDFDRARSLAHLILGPGPSAPDRGFGVTTVLELSADLLPGWYEDWALLEAEGWRQLRSSALERLSADFVAARRFAEAVTAAHAAVRADPLRESSQASLIRAHLAEGNAVEALLDFQRYEQRLHRATGLLPTPALHQLLTGLDHREFR